MLKDKIWNEILDKYGEYLEMICDDKKSLVVVDVLMNMLIEERQKNEYYRRRLDYVSANSAN